MLKFKNMKKLLLGMLLFLGIWAPGLFALENLLPNPSFRPGANGLPESWYGYQDRPGVFSLQNSAVTLKEKDSHYTSYLTCIVPVNGFKSYRFTCETMSSGLTKNAGIYYYWKDKKGNTIGKERFVHTFSGSNEWQEISADLTPEDPVRTASLQICMAVYHSPEGKGHVSYRSPRLVLNTGAPPPPKKAIAGPRQKSIPRTLVFPHNLTSREAKDAFYLEGTHPGYLNLSSGDAYLKPVILTLSAPKQLSAELHLLHFGKSATTRFREIRPGVYHIPAGIDWHAWGNSLFLKNSGGLPENFSIGLVFTDLQKHVLYRRTVSVKILPPAPALRLPSDFRAYSWYSMPLARIDLADPENRLPRELFSYWKEAGFHGGGGDISTDPQWKSFVDVTRYLPYIHNQDSKMQAARNAAGLALGLICPEAIIAQGKDYYLRHLRSNGGEKIISKAAQDVVFDYEPYAIKGCGWVTGYCFCRQCRSKFSKFIKIDRVPDCPEILEKYSSQWVKFRCYQRSEVVKMMSQAVHEINPGVRFILCSMPMPPVPSESLEYFKNYGIDLRMHDQHVDGHMPMNYVQNKVFYQSLFQDARHLKKELCPVLDNGWGSEFNNYDPSRTRLQILACGFAGIRRFYIARGLMNMDGKWLKMYKLTMNDIRKIEPWIRRSSLADSTWRILTDNPKNETFFSASRKLSYSEELHLLLNNSGAGTLFTELKSPVTGDFQVRDLLSDQMLSPNGRKNYFSAGDSASPCKIKLPPFSCRILLVRTGRKASSSNLEDLRPVIQEEQKILQLRRQQYQKQTRYGSTTSLDQEGLNITTAAQSVTIDLNHDAVIQWSKSGKILARKACMDTMLSPELMKLEANKAELISCEILPDRVKAVCSIPLRQPAYQGLIINKTYLVHSGNPRIDVEIAIEPSKGYRPFRYRAVNILSFGSKNPLKRYGDIVQYQLFDTHGKLEYTDKGNTHCSFVRKGRQNTFPRYGEPKYFSGSRCRAVNTVSGDSIAADFQNVRELFMWRDSNLATLEILYEDAYPDNDPHKVKTWKTRYSLVYLPRTNSASR